MVKRGDVDWRERKRAQIMRLMELVPGIQVSVVNEDVFTVRFTTPAGEEVVEIGRPDQEVIRFRNNDVQKPYTMTIPGVDLPDSVVDDVGARWQIGQSAADLPGVRVLV